MSEELVDVPATPNLQLLNKLAETVAIPAATKKLASLGITVDSPELLSKCLEIGVKAASMIVAANDPAQKTAAAIASLEQRLGFAAPVKDEVAEKAANAVVAELDAAIAAV